MKEYKWLVFPLLAVLGVLILTLAASRVGIEQSAIATSCSAAALATSACVGFMVYKLNHRGFQEPWLVTYREEHKDFWKNNDMSKVRCWIACDGSYKKELLPVLRARLDGEIEAEQYAKLDTVDRFCAVLLRLVNVGSTDMDKLQRETWESLGYHYWLYKVKQRSELSRYIENHWEHLYPAVRDAKMHPSLAN
ncbi:hypothetical protein [Alteromonas naphthalenivorans]|uniref:DUF4760 domain-containing protein n=1 Tax=Alteromonas naphthalenivorans TaxID=715451 RepID=F5Z5E0_ALTNA|nr:hypothetical protein [Alteromonas naphthalenivorans]AEF04866.1 hypothetical protein ambt_16805 [Alteromonas naphthalenivorans]